MMVGTEQFDRLLAVANQNVLLASIERRMLILMAHIAQGIVAPVDVVDLIPEGSRELLETLVIPALAGKSRRYRKRALVLTYHLLGVSDDTVAEVCRLLMP